MNHLFSCLLSSRWNKYFSISHAHISFFSAGMILSTHDHSCIIFETFSMTRL
ncbi:unnamed protein product [Amoebophrya sp. A120]|nr:unnamed protein product [Amoebophrya sp. A120]|eukprot:GSA120T00016017001.1